MSNKILWLFLRFEWLLLRLKLKIVAHGVSFFVRLFLSAQIPPEVRIGTGTVFGYGGLCVVIHKDCHIGENCRLGSGVTLGSRHPHIGVPNIGNNVYIGSGAKILGPVRVSDNSVIGANAVVTRDVDEGCVVAGIPARVIARNIDITKYNESFF